MAVAGLRRSPLWERLDRRTLLGVGLAALAAVLVLTVTRPDPRHPVLVAESDLRPGVPLAEQDVGVREVASPDGLVAGNELGELGEWTLAHPLAAGEPLVPSLLAPPQLQTAPNLFALAVEQTHAVLGRLSAGDHIDIYVTWPATGGEPARTELLASDVYVTEARLADQSLGGRSQVELLLAVDDSLAAGLASAVRTGELDLVRRGP